MASIDNSLLSLLKQNARLSISDLAASLSVTPEEISETLKKLEKNGTIVQYSIVVNETKHHGGRVRALIELNVRPEKQSGFERIAKQISQYPFVVDHYLISGSYDFMVIVEGKTLQDISKIVIELASIENITRTATHFILKKYKEMGAIIEPTEEERRLAVSP